MNMMRHINPKTLDRLKIKYEDNIIVFNKIDAFKYDKKDEDDLTPTTRANLSLDDLKKSWMSNLNNNCVFISATNKDNVEEFKKIVYDKVKELHIKRYPYNNFLY